MTTTATREQSDSEQPDRDADPRLAGRWIALAAAAMSALTLAATRVTHPAVGTDAIAYIAVGNSIRDGHGIGFWLEHPLTTWPPLWPAMLAAGMKVTGWRGDLVALALNTVLVAACVVLGVAVARRVLRSPKVLAVLAASLAVSPFLVGLAVFVQTEVVFALIALGILFAIMKAGEEAAPRWLVLAGLLSAVGFYVRYQALYVVPVFVLWLVVRAWIQTRAPLKSLVPGLWYAVPAVVPSALWIVRNLSVSDSAMGPRFPSDVGPVENLAGALRTALKFITSIPTAPLLPAAALAAVLGIGALAVLLRATRPADGVPGLGARLAEAWCGWTGLLAVFVLAFTALMVVSRSIIGFDDLDVRLLAPCLVPTSILFLRYVEVVLLEPERTARVRTAGKVLIGVWFVPQVLVTLALLGPANDVVSGFGYNADRALAASTSPALDAMPEGCVPYSNNAGDLYRSGFEAELSPRTVEYKSSQRTHMLEDLTRRVDDGELSCLVWVEYTDDEENYSPEQISKVLDLERLASADGITVYLLHPKQ